MLKKFLYLLNSSLATYTRLVVYRIVIAFYTGSLRMPPKDRLSSTIWWQLAVRRQTWLTSGKQYQACLFGDSISAHLRDSVGGQVFNFALESMSTISLCEQLKILLQAQVKCKKAIIAIGANDAWYRISDDLFIKKLQEAIALVRSMGATEVILIPAFYSTVAASLDPFLAAPIPMVEKINALMGQVAAKEKVPIAASEIQTLFQGLALNEDFTKDGVHLNGEGLNIYRQALLKLVN